MRRRAVFPAAALLAGVLAAAAGANHVPGAVYTGGHSGRDAIEFQVSADGRTITRLKVTRVPVPISFFSTCYITEELRGRSIRIVNHRFSYREKRGSETVSFSGSFTGPQRASGKLELDEGSALICGDTITISSGRLTSGTLTWTASTQSPPTGVPPSKSPATPGRKKTSKAPQIVRHPDVRAEATGPLGAIVSYRPAVVRRATSVRYSKASGTMFPLGTTIVRIKAKNRFGTSRSAFKVTVVDTTPPVFGSLTDITVAASSSGGATVNYPAVTATDRVDPHPSVSCFPLSGSLFPVGTTTVSCSARDASGNTATGSFRVVVNSAQPPAAVCNITQDHSLASTTPATIEFVNETGGTVSVFWLAFDGSRQFWFSLLAGRSQVQGTYIGHAWLVTNSAGACIGYVVSDQPQKRYVIR